MHASLDCSLDSMSATWHGHGVKQITVRLDDEMHRAVKVRAAQDGVAMEALGRVWFEAYGLGGTVTASTETTVRQRELAAGASVTSGGRATARPMSAAASSEGQVSDALTPAASSCRRAHLHHTNHGGKPCPVCGWPEGK